jgi:hypothetical protein
MMIAATMMTSAAPRIAIASSPAEYFGFFFAGTDRDCVVAFFFFLRGFFDILTPFYREIRNLARYPT